MERLASPGDDSVPVSDEDERVAVVVASARAAAEGADDADTASYLDAWRARMATYRILHSRLSDVALLSGTTIVKGLALADRYPAGWLRISGDLDLSTPNPAELWRMAVALQSWGWRPAAFAITVLDGVMRPAIGFTLPSTDPRLEDAVVEISTLAFHGNLRSVPHVADYAHIGGPLAEPARQVVSVLQERLQRPIEPRDVIDLAVVLDELDSVELRRLRAVIDGLGLWPEWNDAERALRRIGVAPKLPRASVFRRGKARARRMARWVASFSSVGSIAWLAGTAEGALGSRIGERVGRHVSPTVVLRSGRSLYGIPLDAARREDDVTLVEVPSGLVAATPVGTFLLTYCRVVDEDLVERVSKELRALVPASGPVETATHG